MFSTPVIVRGGGDLATGVIQKLARAGFRVLALEIGRPTAIRRTVALCEAVYTGAAQVEDIVCRRIDAPSDADACWLHGEVPLLVDPQGDSVTRLRPRAVIDATLAKRNLGTHRGMAPITVALGPGFIAGVDVDTVIETMRGHNLGRLILQGPARANTGIPGEIGGQSLLRVLRSPAPGEVRAVRQIGDAVGAGEIVCTVGGEPVRAPFDGLLRGLLREGLTVPKGMKIGDVDPRTDVDWHTISDKARCLGGAALEAVLYLNGQRKAESE